MTFPERAVSIISITIPLTLKVSEHAYMNCEYTVDWEIFA